MRGTTEDQLQKTTSETFTKRYNWFPLYDVFRHLKQELEIDLNSLKRFFESSKTPSLC